MYILKRLRKKKLYRQYKKLKRLSRYPKRLLDFKNSRWGLLKKIIRWGKPWKPFLRWYKRKRRFYKKNLKIKNMYLSFFKFTQVKKYRLIFKVYRYYTADDVLELKKLDHLCYKVKLNYKK